MESGPTVSEARGAEDVRRFTVTAGDARLDLAVVNGLGSFKKSVGGLLDPAAGLHFVEVMSCPGGCVAAAGSRTTPTRRRSRSGWSALRSGRALPQPPLS